MLDERSAEEMPALSLVGSFLRPPQLKTTVILIWSPIAVMIWKYPGSVAFFNEHLARLLPSGSDTDAIAAYYSFTVAFLALGLIPALIVKFMFRERLADYGVRLGNARTWTSMAVLLPLFLALGYFSSDDPVMRQYFPMNRSACKSPEHFALHVATYFLLYIAWEFQFRGFVQHGLAPQFGVPAAILVQTALSTLGHLDHPGSETFGSLFGGLLWGFLAVRTRSLLSGLSQHFALGVCMDYCLCFVRR